MQRGLHPTSPGTPRFEGGNNDQRRIASDAVSTGPCWAQLLWEREFPILSSRKDKLLDTTTRGMKK